MPRKHIVMTKTNSCRKKKESSGVKEKLLSHEKKLLRGIELILLQTASATARALSGEALCEGWSHASHDK